MSKIYIGIDNGVSGSIGIVDQDGRLLHFGPMPTFSQTSYLKTKVRNRTRINYKLLHTIFDSLFYQRDQQVQSAIKCFLERPMINNKRFVASISAIAALETVLICLEDFNLAYEYCDSKSWQKLLFPQGCKGDQLKIASRDIGVRLFPEAQGKHVDCDGLLIAEWARRMNL